MLSLSEVIFRGTFVHVIQCSCTCVVSSGNRNKGKGNGAGLAWESQSHCFADKFGKPYTHFFGTDTQHDYSRGNCRLILSIIIKLEYRLVYCKF